ncbi:NADP-dependent oxidoreductase [Agrilactobacillus fermenti]|uniref:NADP-dependent oxidoreductase n=1 Tax=Agrilactobacillus fermenti TaxID=2586909 RepID=UPI003A5C6B4E
MLAFGYRRYGGPEVFEVIDIPEPQPKKNELLLDVLAVGLNNRERAERAGTGYGGHTSGLIISGRDAVGRIIGVGTNLTTDFRKGMLVATHTEHAYAAQVLAEPDNSALIPENVTPTTAAGLITPGITAYKAIHLFAQIHAGDTVIVKGASGGVGLIAVQLLKNLQAHVIGIASSKKEGLVKAAGVDEFVAYDQVDVSQTLAERGDVVFNLAMNGVGGADDVAMVKAGGTIASVAHDTPASHKTITFNHIHPTNTISDHEALAFLLDQVAQGHLTVDIGQELPFTLEGIIAGHNYLENPHDGRAILKRA